jgi:hypothetical protein
MAIVLIELDPQHSGMTRAPIEDDAGMFAQVAEATCGQPKFCATVLKCAGGRCANTDHRLANNLNAFPARSHANSTLI